MKNTKSFIIVGLGYGDEGKGTMTDYLCRTNDIGLVVRYNGGSQAAHNVVTDDNRHHTFQQIGSGAFVPGVKTLLSKYMMLDPIALGLEVAVLSPKIGEHALDRHFIDARTPIITPFHVATNCFKEWVRSGAKHGSCGKGIGETGADLMYIPDEVIRAGDLLKSGKVEAMLRKIQARKRDDLVKFGVQFNDLPEYLEVHHKVMFSEDEPARIAQTFAKLAREFNVISPDMANQMMRECSIVFEGAQGILLDEWHGFHPYTTWSTITPKNALALLAEAHGVEKYEGEKEIIGVTRSFATRHGAGPFPTEKKKMRNIWPGEHNCQNEFQDSFRVGGFDCVTFRYACAVAKADGGLDSIALTHLDVFLRGETVPVFDRYECGDFRNMVRDIPVAFDQDLDRQERVTHTLLHDTHPIQTAMCKEAADIYFIVSDQSRVPVKYTSHGPKPSDKVSIP